MTIESERTTTVADRLKGSCRESGVSYYAKCPNMKCTYEGMDGERYRCEKCGQSYFLDYEEMK